MTDETRQPTRELLVELYRHRDMHDVIDNISCRHCAHSGDCNANEYGCTQSPEEAVDLFIRFGMEEMRNMGHGKKR